MDIRYMYEFIVLAQTGKYIDAAEALFLSQSTLSKHIKVLEDEFGYRLFDRSAKKLKLTDFGEQFLPYAIQISELYEEFMDNARLTDTHSKAFTIGISRDTLLYPRIHTVLTAAMVELQGYNVDFVEATNAQLYEMLRMNKCNLAIVCEQDKDVDENQDFLRTCMLEDKVVVVVPEEHYLSKKEKITSKELGLETFAHPTEGSVYTEILVDYCERKKIKIKNDYTVSRRVLLFDIVSYGYAVSLFSKRLSIRHNGDISVVPLDEDIPVYVNILKNPKRRYSREAEEYVKRVLTESEKPGALY